MITCKICGAQVEPHLFEEHLQSWHRLTWEDYFEICKLSPSPDSVKCWNCGSYRGLLTPWIRNSMFFLPCSNCGDQGTRKDNILSLLGKYCSKILSDKYYQDILVHPEWLHSHQFHSMILLKEFLKEQNLKYSKHSRIYINYAPWTIKEISERNKSGIEVTLKNRELECIKLPTGDKFEIILSGKKYYIEMPEPTIFDIYHHSRYSIFNMKEYTRRAKRLKFQDQSCIKLYEPVGGLLGIKSILRLSDGTNYVDPRTLTEDDQISLKLIILRTVSIRELLIKIYLEISRYSSYLNDFVFIGNHIILGESSGKTQEPGFIFSWFARDEYLEGNINLCIL